MPPETPIQDVVDHCHVWESHADPAVRRVSKPSPDSIYPAYVVGSLADFGGVGRWDHGWGRSRMGVST